MKNKTKIFFWLLSAGYLILATTAVAQNLQEGKDTFRRACQTCHGLKGDGQGPSAAGLPVKPADFTQGVFKFKTAPAGSIPTDQDLIRTVTEGVPGTDMFRWGEHLSETQIKDVIEYIKSFSSRFKEEKPDEIIQIPQVLQKTAGTIAKGKELYNTLQCFTCHGVTGKGDGPASLTLVDDLGRPIPAANFTTGVFKSGRSSQDLYRTIALGLEGTPMPEYRMSATSQDIWSVVHYIETLAHNGDEP